ncbi:MAG: biotin--[acetyl-CoA-carboxylase] ligase [Candidatus Omnitrophica bacterium]|nr:biotin--[acetyl-CoA-carboxylase] ligase [Candidatus Omnitrophota bacterium]
MLDDKILHFFKKRGSSYVSGEELSEAFGVSRTAVWKHIEKLRDEGYEIAASPHLGYKLMSVPDRLTSVELGWQLNTEVIGKRIYSYKEIGSTNDVAYSLATQGEKEGSIVIAEYQTKGRGRLGRKWISPRAKGVYFSVILRPDILPKDISVITLISSLSVAKTIRDLTNLAAFIKWPNDVLINKQKVCGILTELNGETDKINFVIVGIGINVNAKKELLPKEATSLSVEKERLISRLEFVKMLLRNLDVYYKIFNKGKIDQILKEYKRLSAILDRRVRVNYHNSSVSGHAIDVDKEGALILRLDSGFHERVLAGDVVLLR